MKLECLEALKKLAKISKLTIVWIPGHERLVENENTDALAKKGAENKFIGPEPFFEYNRSSFRKRLLTWESKAKEKRILFLKHPNQENLSDTLKRGQENFLN